MYLSKKEKKAFKKDVKSVKKALKKDTEIVDEVARELLKISLKKGPEEYAKIWHKLAKKVRKLNDGNEIDDIVAIFGENH